MLSGKTPFCSELLNMCFRGFRVYGITNLTRHMSISSWPFEFVLLALFSSANISSSVTGLRNNVSSTFLFR